jgi:hypothetical protein
MKTNVLLLYPIFLKCCTHLFDPFWIYLFEDLAYCKCPYGIIIQDNTIYSIQKNKEFSYCFIDKDPKIIANELCEILSTRLNILSEKDHLYRRNYYVSYYENLMNNITSWNEIKKKKFKDLLLEQFVLNVKKEKNYSWLLTRQLFSILLIGIQFKTILAKHIYYKNGQIHNIDGIICDSKRIICMHNLFISKQTMEHIHLPKKNNRLSLHWKRYLYSI